MPHVSDRQRRARLATRHALAPGFAADSPESVVQAMTVLHATEPATVYLTCQARVPGLEVADVDRALYVDRSIVKQLAMRRTLFVFPKDLLASAWPSASARVARTERARLAKDVEDAGVSADGAGWVDEARAAMLAELSRTPDGRQAAELRVAVPMVDVKVAVAGGVISLASRLLTLLGVDAAIVRGANAGGWHTSRPRWTLMEHWLDPVPEPAEGADGYRELVRRWLHSFGPGTEEDIVWWLGSTKAVVRTALADLQAQAVTLDHGATGWLLPDDVDDVDEPDPWVALLPVLDPTVMGWKGRDFFLGPHYDQLFDRTGNVGTTAWVDGRVVGCWVQDDAGVVQVRLLEPVAARARRALHDEAARLTAWLDGLRVPMTYKSPAMTAPFPP